MYVCYVYFNKDQSINPLRGADYPSDIGQESGRGHGFVVEFSFTRQSCHQQQLLPTENDQMLHQGASIRYG